MLPICRLKAASRRLVVSDISRPTILLSRRFASITPKGPGAVAANEANATAARDRRLAGESASKKSAEPSATTKLENTLAKFWDKVGCVETPAGFLIELDGKTIKTPLGQDLLIPKEKQSLAYLIMNEWKSLPNLHVRPYLLPLTSLASRALDLKKAQTDPEAEAQVGSIDKMTELLLRYLDTDTLLVLAPKKDCDGELRKEQQDTYYPIMESMEKYLGQFTEDGKAIELKVLDTETSGITGNRQPEAVVKAAHRFLDTLDTWQLVALERTTLTCKSFLCAVAVIRINDPNDSFNYTLEQLARAATLETVLQTERWGEVEDTHDVEKVDVRRHLAAASLLCYSKP